MKKVLIAVDIGNTKILIGLYAGKKLLGIKKISTAKLLKFEYNFFPAVLKQHKVKSQDIEGIIVSSVVPFAVNKLKKISKKFLKIKPVILGIDLRVPITNQYDNPNAVGQDRLVCAYKAYSKYKSKLIIIDYGTGITFDVISARGEYKGGLIFPGISIAYQALIKNAALLPSVKLKEPKQLIGKNTPEAMNSGMFHGIGALTDGMVDKIKRNIGKNVKVIATGGYAHLIKKYSKQIDRVEDNLMLDGLKEIYTKI